MAHIGYIVHFWFTYEINIRHKNVVLVPNQTFTVVKSIVTEALQAVRIINALLPPIDQQLNSIPKFRKHPQRHFRLH